MTRINIVKFREDVRKAKNELHVTQKQLAKEAGVGHALLSKLFNKKLKYPTHKSVAGLCSALGLDAADYYVTAPELQREEVVKTYVGAKATLARANALLDDAQTKLDAIKAKSAEDTPEAVANDLAEARLAALEEAHARIKELEAENKCLRATLPDCDPGEDEVDDRPIEEQLEDAKIHAEAMSRNAVEAWNERDAAEQKLVDANAEITRLKNALSVAEKLRRSNGLTIEFHADDRLLSDLFKFLANLKVGVERAEN